MEVSAVATKELRPFRDGTRQRISPVASLVFNAGKTVKTELPKIGYLAAIYLRLTGVQTNSGATALTDDGIAALLKRIQLVLNQGYSNVVDISGPSAQVLQRWSRYGFSPDKAGVGDTVPDVNIFRAGVAGGANNWDLFLRIPVAANDGRDFDLGLINLQAPEIRATVAIDCGVATDATALGTGFVGTIEVSYEFYDVPDTQEFAQPPLTIVRTIEEVIPVNAVGDVVYTVPPAGILMQDYSIVRLNGVKSDSFDKMRVRFNKNDTVYEQARQELKSLERMRTGMNPGVGIAHYDLFNSFEQISAGDMRDGIDSEELATLEIIHTISAGAGLGANNNGITHVRRFVQTLEG
jgi:hypothetical protein